MPAIVNTKNGQFMVLPNDAIGKHLAKYGDFEPHFRTVADHAISAGLQNGRGVCVDAGANIGYHTVGMAKLLNGAGQVVAFEPQRIIFQQLSGNVFLNNLRNVTTINAALGDKNDTIAMDYINLDQENINVGGTKVGSGGNVAEMLKLDDLGLLDVSFMKVDIQGCEVAFLRGAKDTITRSRPVMFVEVENHLLNCFGESSETLLNALLALDYILIRIDNEYTCDHVAIPKEKEWFVSVIYNNLGSLSIIKGKSVKVHFDRKDAQPNILYGTYEVTP